MSRRIAVIGTGYVGLITAVGLADFGNSLVGVDLDPGIVETLNRGASTLYEPGLEEYLRRNIEAGRLRFTTDINSAVQDAEIVFIAVGTPSKNNGEADLSQVETVIERIASNLNSHKIIVTKSTVPVGTNRWIKEELLKKTGDNNFEVASNPEFLREGKALHDFFHPDRIVIGYESERVKAVMEDIYRALYLIQTPFIWCDPETAELIKYASNAFLAAKITFINQMANLAEAVGSDIHLIARSMGMDGRISSKFLHPGPGYGGSCFPKDTKAIVQTGERYGVDMSIIKEVIRANEKQKLYMVDKLKKVLGSFSNKKVAVLGLAFKAETDDVRESPALTIIKKLLEEGVTVKAHDPKAIDNAKKIFPDIEYCKNEFEAVKDTDACLICTEWNEYRNLDLEKMKELMKDRVILDLRNVLDIDEAKKLGFIYQGVGRR